jgi:hypothetical protein
MAYDTNVNSSGGGGLTPAQQAENDRLNKASESSKGTQAEMARLAAEGRLDALQAAQLAAQASRIEALGKNLKKGADAAKNLT